VSNVARDVIWPTDTDVLVRAAFLYVGQGDCTIVLVKDGDTYKTLVVDINLDDKNGGVDVPRLVKDLLEDEEGKLPIFVNTHPHNDHLRGVLALSDEVDIQEVWHSGHKPGKKHDDAYQDLQKVIRKVRTKHGPGAETKLQGSRSRTDIGDAHYYVLAPAEYVTEDVEGEAAEERYRRIHEQSAVLKFGKDDTWVLLAGDADRDAWEKHITNYHKGRLPSKILGAAHHGSRTFFRYDKEDDPYLDALQNIGPDYVILSAPKSNESPHGHPHDDAVELYEEEVGKDNVLHTGASRECFICDVLTDGAITVESDTRLVEEYRLGGDEDKTAKKAAAVAPAVVSATRIDRRPMG
jgi:beta-lactamase superfamily II metal-dependent hydrolase